ncbi:MAG TPA: aspartyl protease family protein [Longimicrobiaceae bacterium]|nr:aspartyl protease family protein [Longimicrobiaceae bacterium]
MSRTRLSARALALAASLCLLLAAPPGCVALRAPTGLFAGGDGDLSSATPEQRRQAFWAAVSDMEMVRATRIAPGREHAEFARGMRLVLDGRMAEAEQRFAPLAGEAVDSLVRAASRVALSSVFGYDGRWQALHDLTSPTAVPAGMVGFERAGIDVWSASMRLAPEAEYRIAPFPVALRFEITGTGTPLVPVIVNGRIRQFWLDTGTSLTLVASDVAAQAGIRPLSPDTLEIVTSAGRIRALPAAVERLELGPLTATGHAVAVVPARELTILETVAPGKVERVKVDGVIGMDLMRRLNIIVDFPTRVALLSRPRSEPERSLPRNLFWLGYPVVRAQGPGGVPLYFALDTGADSTFVTQNLMRKLPHRLLAQRTRFVAGFGSDTTVRTPVLSELKLSAAGREFSMRHVAVHEQKRLMLFDLDGVLGADLGAGHRVRIDMTNGIFEIGTPRPPRATERRPGGAKEIGVGP